MGRDVGDIPPEMLEGFAMEGDEEARAPVDPLVQERAAHGMKPGGPGGDLKPGGDMSPSAYVKAQVERRVRQSDPERWRAEERRRSPFTYERSGG